MVSHAQKKNLVCLVLNHAWHVFSNTKPIKGKFVHHIYHLLSMQLSEKKRFRLYLDAKTPFICDLHENAYISKAYFYVLKTESLDNAIREFSLA